MRLLGEVQHNIQLYLYEAMIGQVTCMNTSFILIVYREGAVSLFV